jgi:aminoglycoside 3'-phosphotransferase-2
MATTEPPEIDPPLSWSDILRGYRWTRQTIGCSDAGVFRCEADGRPSLFLKTEPAGPFAEVPGEALRLRWLADHGVACPQVLGAELHDNRNWLLTVALGGHDATSLTDVPAANIVQIVAEALRGLHALDTNSCPFDHRLDNRIALARSRMEAGKIDDNDFDEARQGRSPADLFDELMKSRPNVQDTVVAHGDACLPNILIDQRRFSGFVDCGRTGIADRYQDLALACRSISSNLGEAWVAPFLQRYGLTDPDMSRLAFYQLLDEFF